MKPSHYYKIALMLVNLKNAAAQSEPHILDLSLDERLPAAVMQPCLIHCEFEVRAFNDYYLIDLTANAKLVLVCQRCLNEFDYPYFNQTTLAACRSEEVAEKLMNHYECLVFNQGQVDFKELLTDELYLYTPQSHPKISDCDEETACFLNQQQSDSKGEKT